MSVKPMFEDNREITTLYFPGGHCTVVGIGEVEKIEVYQEPGECGYVPWFAVYRGGVIVGRVNGIHVESIRYKEDE